jgi:CspA family cold shock protein
MNDIGFVNAYNDFKGFGFIRREKGKDVYFSIDNFKNELEIDSIVIGLKLAFDVEKTKKGPKALNIYQI